MSDLDPPASWQSMKDIDACPTCGTGFSIMVRQHHCCMCGQVVCWYVKQKTRVLALRREEKHMEEKIQPKPTGGVRYEQVLAVNTFISNVVYYHGKTGTAEPLKSSWTDSMDHFAYVNTAPIPSQPLAPGEAPIPSNHSQQAQHRPCGEPPLLVIRVVVASLPAHQGRPPDHHPAYLGVRQRASTALPVAPVLRVRMRGRAPLRCSTCIPPKIRSHSR